MSETAILEVRGKKYELPVIEGTENEVAVDIRKLRAASGVVTLDSGYKNTGATESAITYLDGEKGILRYRGYRIEELATKSTFTEVIYLLLHGELPTKAQLNVFNRSLAERAFVHEDLRNILDGFPATAHPMGVMSSLISALTAFHPQSLDPNRPEEEKYETALDLIAKVTTLAAWTFRKEKGLPTRFPRVDMGYSESFLYQMFSLPNLEFELNPVVAKALDQLLIVHADHEQNCSTSAVRLVGSANSSLYASISAGFSALWGPLHGGANQAVIEMLETIRREGGGLEKWVNKAKDKNDPFRLMGFGHRVYRNFDPRSRIIKKSCDDVLEALGIDDPILDIAKELEEYALKDQYFIDRGLYPNVDFYSGIIYRALGIPTEMFTVMFAIGRLPGWIAQFREMRDRKEPIGRPRQIYTGYNERSYVPMEERGQVLTNTND